ncbi:MAG: LysE family transporter [Muribaculaceae bacterium]|nr:LysE family transporter [Muribaculaceae bacterium]
MELALYTILRGLAIGILISAPMGPIGVLCIQRTLNKGQWAGFFTGVGAAMSDIIYCMLTGLGMSFIIDFIETNQNIIQILGSIVLLVFGAYLIKRNPAGRVKSPGDIKQKNTYTQDFITGFFLTFSNPLILFLIIGLFARFNFLQPEMSVYITALGFVFIVLGAMLWWLTITFFVNKVRAHFNLRSIWLVNRIIGVVIIIMSMVGLVWGLKDFLML